jgi:RNA polymerase sigma-70 factor (family 1)
MTDYPSLTDTELLGLLKLGDDAAFAEIYSRYWEFLFQSSYNILKDSDACNDIVQEVFVWFWVNRKRHITDAFKPYLYAAAKYKAANIIRHGKVKEAFFTRSVQDYQEAVPDENNIEVQELKEIIAQFTQSLPERAKLIFQLSRNEYLTNKEIAERLGISEKTVENQMNINLKKLKTIIGQNVVLEYLAIVLLPNITTPLNFLYFFTLAWVLTMFKVLYSYKRKKYTV